MPVTRQKVRDLGFARLRTTFVREERTVQSWATQLEWRDPGAGWTWVARFDTAGGIPHRDRHRLESHEPVQLPDNPAEAIKAARRDLYYGAEAYIAQYLAAGAGGGGH